jgi:hypothetical protein
VPPQPNGEPDARPVRSPFVIGLGVAVLVLGIALTVWMAVEASIAGEWSLAATFWAPVVVILWFGRLMWRARRGNVEFFTGEDLDASAAESRAMLQSLEAYDLRLSEARPEAVAELESRSDRIRHSGEIGGG